MKILYQYASRCRPARFFAGLYSILNNQNDKENFIIHVVMDTDDPTIDASFVEKMQDITNALGDKIIWNFGTSTGKIDAINRPLPKVDWDILVNFSDDMRFTVKSFDDIIRMNFDRLGLDSFIHFPDQDAGEALSTMSIIGRPYFERDGYIYHKAYFALWCDNEAMEVAKRRGCYHYNSRRIFDHLLPTYGHLPPDAQFIHQQNYFSMDQQTYQERLAKNFDL